MFRSVCFCYNLISVYSLEILVSFWSSLCNKVVTVFFYHFSLRPVFSAVFRIWRGTRYRLEHLIVFRWKPPTQTFLGLRNAFLPQERSRGRDARRSHKNVCMGGYRRYCFALLKVKFIPAKSTFLVRELSIKTRQNKPAEVKTEKYVPERDPPYPWKGTGGVDKLEIPG